MARTESRTKTSIWTNPDFVELTCHAQRLYWMLFSQPTISLCGVLAYTPGRWRGMAADESREAIEESLTELSEAGFIVVDRDTEEVLVRSFMRNDGVWNSPKTRAAATGHIEAVLSEDIRDALSDEVSRLEHPDQNTPPDRVSSARRNRVSDRSRTRGRAVSDSISVSDSDTTGSETELELLPGEEPIVASPSARKSDPIFDALTQACGIDPSELSKASRGPVNVALKSIRESSPDVTPAEIHRRAEHYRLRFEHAELTATALAKHWPSLGTGPIRPVPRSASAQSIDRVMAEAESVQPRTIDARSEVR